MRVDEEILLRHMVKKVSSKRNKLLYLVLLQNGEIEHPLIPNIVFSLAAFTDANCELEFRFDIAGLQRLCVLLRVPDVIITAHRDRVVAIEALCIMLRRLAYPQRLYEHLLRFGRPRAALSRIFLHMVEHVHDKFPEKIYFAHDLVEKRMELYCTAIQDKGAPIDSNFGFPDGTKLRVCRPSPRPGAHIENLQKYCYSGHKRCHCLNYQAVTAPDGMCIHLWGPMEGRRHDSAMLRESRLMNYFEEHDDLFGGRFLYGDPAYGVQKFILSGYKGNVSDPFERAFNKKMSSVRESVEWNLKCLKTLWAFVAYAPQQKIGLSPVGKFVKVAMLLTNCHNCHSGGNQISSYFGLQPPTLDEYIG